MQMEQIADHIAKSGFSRAVVNGQHIEVLLQERQGEAYGVVLVDCQYFSDLTVVNYENMLRGIRSSLYNYNFEEVHLLSVLCTPDPDTVKELIAGFGEHWVVDLKEKRLLIYENQILTYLNLKELIEEALLYEDAELAEAVHQQQIYRKVFRQNWCTFALVLINVVIFAAMFIIGNFEDPEFMLDWGAMAPFLVGDGVWEYRIFTSIFLHFDITHLANNMFMLLVMGFYLEKYMEKWKYLTIYLGAGVIGNVASLCYYIYHGDLYVVCAGASGAIFGITGAFLWLILHNRGWLDGISWKHMLFLIVLNIYLGFSDPSVGNVAHIGGLIGGFVIAMVLCHDRGKEESAS